MPSDTESYSKRALAGEIANATFASLRLLG
jgi:hypothetical protein